VFAEYFVWGEIATAAKALAAKNWFWHRARENSASLFRPRIISRQGGRNQRALSRFLVHSLDKKHIINWTD